MPKLVWRVKLVAELQPGALLHRSPAWVASGRVQGLRMKSRFGLLPKIVSYPARSWSM